MPNTNVEDEELRSKICRIAYYLNEMGEAEEGQDGWYMNFDRKIDELMQLIAAEKAKAVEEAESRTQAYVKSIFRDRARTNPNMTFAEYWEGQYNRKYDLRGAELTSTKDKS